MAPDVGFVARASERDADVRPPHRPRDGLGDRGLPDARGADEQQDVPLELLVVLVAGPGRRPALLAQLAYGQELEHLILHVLQAVVVLFEDLPSPFQGERFLHPLVPGKLRDGLEVRPDHLRFHRIAVGPLQPVELAVDFLAGGLGELDRLEALAQLPDLTRLVALTELLADGLELLAQQHLALPLTQLLLHLRFDIFLRVEHADLALHVHQDAPQTLLHGERLEQCLAVGGLDVEMPRHQVGEASWVGHALEHLLHDLFGQPRLLAQLPCALAGLAVQPHECGIFGIEGWQLPRFQQVCYQVAARVAVMDRGRAHVPVQRQLHAPEAALDLTDPGHRSERVQSRRGHDIDVLPLHHRENAPRRALERRFYGLERRRAAGSDGRGYAREQHHVPEGQHGESQFLTHLLTHKIEETHQIP